MATSVARKAVGQGFAVAKAWAALPPGLCGSTKVVPDVVKSVPLKRDNPAPEAQEDCQAHRPPPARSFKMHIGAALHIPTRDARDLPQMQQQPAATAQQDGLVDPFEGLPFRGFAERLGSAILPSVEAARQAERQAKLAARHAAEEAEVVLPEVPHVLPFTRWAASSTQFRSTFIADPPKERKKARLSWYHPDDTMVPRDWFRGGLLEDLKYYSPFGLGKQAAAVAAGQEARAA